MRYDEPFQDQVLQESTAQSQQSSTLYILVNSYILETQKDHFPFPIPVIDQFQISQGQFQALSDD